MKVSLIHLIKMYNALQSSYVLRSEIQKQGVHIIHFKNIEI